MAGRRTASNAIARLIDSAWIGDDDMSARYVRFFIGDEAVGWLTPEFGEQLREWPRVFERTGDDHVRLIASPTGNVDDADALSATLAEVIGSLAERKIITGLRHELYAVRVGFGPGERTLVKLERAAARAFGITSHAVHVNGITNRHGKPSLWIARRAANKAIDPGMLDNMIGGGVPAELSVRETLVKEAWEEAGIEAQLAARATDGRRLRIRRAVPEGLQSELIFVHDLAVPAHIVPRNQDGEVADFRLLDPDRVLELIGQSNGNDAMTVDASLVTLDWLERHGHAKLPDTASARAIYRTGGWT